MDEQLPHTRLTQDLLKAGRRKTAAKNHNARVAEQMARAKAGETINLSDLMGAKDELIVDALGDERDG